MTIGIIFDWDNTLVNSIPAIKQSVADTLEAFHYQGDRKKILDSAGVKLSLRESFPDFFAEEWQNAAEYFYKKYQQYSTLTEKMQGFDALMLFLQNNHLAVELAINSNKKQMYLDNEIQALNVANLFPIAIGAGQMPKDKPAPNGVNHIKNLWKTKPGTIYYVGDSDVDMQCAANANINAIFVNSHSKTDLETSHKVKNLVELRLLLEKIIKNP